jgi:hypothetical protein
MKNFETNSRTDTVLSGGLIAIGILWAVLAAIQAALPAASAPAYAATSATALHAVAGSNANAAMPAAAERIAVNSIS